MPDVDNSVSTAAAADKNGTRRFFLGKLHFLREKYEHFLASWNSGISNVCRPVFLDESYFFHATSWRYAMLLFAGFSQA